MPECPPIITDEFAYLTKQMLPNLKGEFNSYKEFCDHMRKQTFDPTATDESYKNYCDAVTNKLPNGKLVFKYDINYERSEYTELLEQVKAVTLGNRPEPDNWYLITQVMCPTLIIRGAKSTMMPKEVMQKMVGLMPNAKGVEMDCGHIVYLDKPDEFNKIVMEFLESN